MSDYRYILMYNADTDFIPLYTDEDVKREIIGILEEGYDQSEITVFEVKEIPITIAYDKVRVTLG
jgi:hypothetical protein